MKIILSLILGFASTNRAQAVDKSGWLGDIDEFVTKIEKYHPNPYSHISKIDFHHQAQMLKEKVPRLDEPEIQFAMMRLVSLLRDRHTALHPLDPNGFNHWLPLNIYKMSDGFYIVGALEGQREILGKKVLKMGRFTADTVFQKLADLHPSDNDFGRDQNS